MKDGKVSLITIQNGILILLLSTFYFTPAWSLQKVIIIYPLLLLWIVTANCNDRSWFGRSTPFFLLLFAFFILDFVRYTTTGDSSIMRSYLTHKLLLYMWPIFLLYYMEHIDQFRKIQKWLVMMLLISAVFTIIGNIQYPEASRLLASSGGANYAGVREMYRQRYIGGYDFIFGIVFLIVPTVVYAKQKRDIKYYILTAIFMVTILVGAYTIGIAIAFASLLLIFGNWDKVSKLVVASAGIICLLFIFYEPLLIGLAYVGETIGADILVKRAEQMLTNTYVSTYGEGNRLQLYTNAILNIFERPILGLLSGAQKSHGSGHSMLLEYFEYYGIFGFVYIIYIKKVMTLIRIKLQNMRVKIACTAWSCLALVFLAIDQFSAAYGGGNILLLVSHAVYYSRNKYAEIKGTSLCIPFLKERCA